MTITPDMQTATPQVPEAGWTPAYDGDGRSATAWVVDITGQRLMPAHHGRKSPRLMCCGFQAFLGDRLFNCSGYAVEKEGTRDKPKLKSARLIAGHSG
jgi:hypothetical protein